MNNIHCSNNLICSALIPQISSTFLLNSFSQARGLQTSLLAAREPVSSMRVPRMWGLRARIRGVEQLWQGVVGELEKIVMPQL
jgi:hypothetical protein